MGRAHIRLDAPHRARPLAGLLLIGLVAVSPALADRRDQDAADNYRDAVGLIEKKRYQEGINLLQKALASGAVEANEQQGSQTRFIVSQYDPYYWLGVALMELGDDEKALINFEESERQAVVKRWPAVYKDLVRRRKVLEERLSVAPALPTKPPMIVRPEPSPTVVAAPTSTLPPLPSPTLVPDVPSIPSAGPLRGGPGTDSGAAALVAADGIRFFMRDVDSWLARADLPSVVRPLLQEQRKTAAAALEAGKRTGSPPGVEARLAAVRAAWAKLALPALRDGYLERAIETSLQRDWTASIEAMEAARRADPAAPQPDLLRAILLATRYLTEERRDPQLLTGAQQAHRAWRMKVGPSRPLPSLASPAIRRLLQ